MSKEEILDYVMNSPGNTNRAVLRTMLGESEPDKNNGRILLYENNSLDISTRGSASIKYAEIRTAVQSPYWSYNELFTLEVDGEILATGSVREKGGSRGVGLVSPGDSEGLSTYSGGVNIQVTGANEDLIVIGFLHIMINGNKISPGVHSVKIYKEPSE